MDIKISFSSIKKLILTFLNRFQIIIFFVIVVGGTAATIFVLNTIIVSSSESNGYTPNTSQDTFDQATIQRIESLKTHTQTGDQLDLSNGRSNPFVE